MPWLVPQPIDAHASASFAPYLEQLEQQLSNPKTDRNVLVRELLAEFSYGQTYQDLLERLPMVALNLDPRNVTLEAEHYAVTDQAKFAQVKPLLWLWQNFDLSPAGQSVFFGIEFRRVLARHVFKRVGRNFKCFPFVSFSVGYNLEVGDDVTIHRNVLVDDIGGVTLHDRASLSDFVNVYSHTHSPLESPDVTLRHTTIGAGVRVTYHATVLGGTTLSDDSMIGTMSVVTKDIEPHTVAFGIPARPRAIKNRDADDPRTEVIVDSREYTRPADRKGNTDFPDFTSRRDQTRVLEKSRAEASD
jgi:acetyltransferase-like isoleucine patch superfamily enzyme